MIETKMTEDTALPSEKGEHHKAHGADWYKYLHQFIGQPVKGLEIGTWMGVSAEWMLDLIFTHPDSRYNCVDTFEGSDEHRLAGQDCSTLEGETRKRLERFGRRAVIFKSFSDQALRYMFRDEKFDFIYIDGAHDAMNVLRDAVLAFDNLNVGGIMIWDDYRWEVMEDAIDRPKMAIDAFLECYSPRLEVIGARSQIAIRKLL